MTDLNRKFLTKVLSEVGRAREEDAVGVSYDLCNMAESLCSMATELLDREDRHNLVVDHAKDEYYHKGRRDLVFEMLADIAAGKTESTDGLTDWELERIKEEEILAYRNHPRSKKAEAH